MQANLRSQLGLTDDMDTYFVRAPHEYWQALGIKPQPYNDNVGEYDFIHAFFAHFDEMSNFADILVSKLGQSGILWISWPKLSADSDITEDTVESLFAKFNLAKKDTLDITDDWVGMRLEHS